MAIRNFKASGFIPIFLNLDASVDADDDGNDNGDDDDDDTHCNDHFYSEIIFYIDDDNRQALVSFRSSLGTHCYKVQGNCN